jgi:hypothetical protein
VIKTTWVFIKSLLERISRPNPGCRLCAEPASKRLAYEFNPPGTASDTSARAALAQSTSFWTVGAPLTPIAPDNFSVHLNGKPSTPRRNTRKRWDAGQKRRVALNKVEKFLRGDA